MMMTRQVNDFKIPDYNNCDPFAENIQEHVLKAIVKYKNHPSILTIGEVYKKNPELLTDLSKLFDCLSH